MVKISHIYQVEVTSLADNGYGLARLHKDVIYVKQALPQERVSVKITKRLQQGYVGEMQSLDETADTFAYARFLLHRTYRCLDQSFPMSHQRSTGKLYPWEMQAVSSVIAFQ